MARPLGTGPPLGPRDTSRNHARRKGLKSVALIKNCGASADQALRRKDYSFRRRTAGSNPGSAASLLHHNLLLDDVIAGLEGDVHSIGSRSYGLTSCHPIRSGRCRLHRDRNPARPSLQRRETCRPRLRNPSRVPSPEVSLRPCDPCSRRGSRSRSIPPNTCLRLRGMAFAH